MFSRIHTGLLLIILTLFALPAGAQPVQIPQNQAQIQLSFAPLVKQVSPSVVNIYTKRMVTTATRSPFMDDPFFAPFFRNQGPGGPGSRMRRQLEGGLGSGLIVEPDGLVVTNAHVTRDADEITVVLSDGREFEGKIVLRDEPSDLALVRIDTKGEQLPFATLKPSEQLSVGDLVLAIGNPFGVGQTVTSGIVSALARSSLDINDFNFFIQTDAAINPGNSGGPLVALDGGVVGINSAIYSRDGGSLGIGFAIPSEMVASVMAAEKNANGKVLNAVIRPWLGVTTQDITSEIAASLGLRRPGGVLVAALHPASPLSKAGIVVGDILAAVNGKEIEDSAEAKFRMATVPLGEKAQFDVMRKGRRQSFEVEAIAPPDTPPRDETSVDGNNPLNGAVIANLNPAVAVELGKDAEEVTGVVVLRTQPGTYASRLFSPGDVIVGINGKATDDVNAVQALLARGTGANGWALSLKRHGRTTTLIIR
jgi:serine protease Do